MRKNLLVAAMLLVAAVVTAEEAGPVIKAEPEKYSFKLYVLAEGNMKKNKARPDFGWRVMKAFPLKAREFTYPAAFIDYSSAEFKAAAENLLNSIEEPRRKNACRVADAVFAYVNTSITSREAREEITENPHKVYYSALQVLKEGKGNSLEKCRLAAAMLRYFTVPARIVEREGRYEVEYYIQPLAESGKGAWYLKDFDGLPPAADAFIVPVSWHPVDAKELLSEEWTTPMFIKLKQQKRTYITADDAEAMSVFAAITETAQSVSDYGKPKRGKFNVIDELEYELWLPNGVYEAKAEFILPFNLEDQLDIKDDFKTVKYFVKTGDERLVVKARWPQTKTKPSQEGIIYTLPAVFTVIKRD